MWVKTLIINPRSQLSLQMHANRLELWHAPQVGLTATIGGYTQSLLQHKSYVVPVNTPHRISNFTNKPLLLTEIATGSPDEEDIVRLEDDYGRS
jgi:mannose-6-phosphate isomerase-like protein (cupin superfamily)